MGHFSRTHPDGGWLGLPPPSVLSITPNTGAATGLESKVIAGSGFTFITNVYIGGRPVDSFVVNSPTQITIVTPLGGAAGTYDVTVESSYTGLSASNAVFITLS